MQVWNVLHAARWKCRPQKIAICAPSYNFVSIDNRKKYISSRCSHNIVNFGLLTAEIGSVVWGTPANFNGFHVLAALLHGSQVVGVSQTAALNRGRHLCYTGRPSCWALAHILVYSLSALIWKPVINIHANTPSSFYQIYSITHVSSC